MSTALEQYIRLEAPGRLRESDAGGWREVLVSFGQASLVLSSFSEEPITHWSLAAVERLEGDKERALYAPGAGAAERLEITDRAMIEAIAEVSRMARDQGPAKRRRPLRALALGLFLLAAIAAGALWGPDALRARAVALVSDEQAGLISQRIRDRLGARPCALREGLVSLERLRRKVAPGRAVSVMPWERPLVARLPDGSLLLARATVERAGSAEAVAGWIALGRGLDKDASPLAGWVRAMTLTEVALFLGSGEIGDADIEAMARGLRRSAPVQGPTAQAAAAERLAAAGIDPQPFLNDIAARFGTAPPPPPMPAASRALMPEDQDWVALQEICAG